MLKGIIDFIKRCARLFCTGMADAALDESGALQPQ